MQLSKHKILYVNFPRGFSKPLVKQKGFVHKNLMTELSTGADLSFCMMPQSVCPTGARQISQRKHKSSL